MIISNEGYLIVDEAPLLKKSVNPHYCTHISRKIPSASGHCKVLRRIKPVCIDHEITIVLIDSWSLASVTTVKEFWKCSLFCFVDRVHVKPGAVAWKDDGMSLCYQVGSGSRL